MKKQLALIMVATMLLTGCQSSKISDPVKENKPVNKPSSETAQVSNKIGEYFYDDEISKILEDKGYEMDKGYALFPDEDYRYSEYVSLNGEMKIVFLHTDTVELYNKNYEGDESFMLNGGAIKLEASVDSAVVNGSPGIIMGGFFPSENLNTSEFHGVKESGYLSVQNNPLSTFAADVDTASYTNFRKTVKELLLSEDYYYGEELHDIRIEEMLNYFDYDFDSSNDKFSVSAEIGNTPWNKNTKLMVLNVKAQELDKESYEGSNLVFLVDTSGSMNKSDKLPLLKESLLLLVDELTDKDRISLVTYSGDERVVFEGLTIKDKDTIIESIENLNPYGFTNGEGGIKKAYEIAEKYMKDYSNSRVIMCSDGDLNVGISSEDKLIDLIEDKKESGVYLSILGFGSGNYKDNKMEALADHGNGNYHYIDSLIEGHKVLVEDMLSTIVTLGDDVKFQIEFNPEYIKGYRKIGYENRDLEDEDFNDDSKDGGEVGYGHEVTIVYELVMVDSEMDIPGFDLKYQNNSNISSEDWMTVSIRYKDHGESNSNLLEFVIDEEFFTEDNSNDWEFISNLVSFGLIVNKSDYAGTSNIQDIIKNLNELELDSFKKEFLSLVYNYNSVEDILNN